MPVTTFEPQTTMAPSNVRYIKMIIKPSVRPHKIQPPLFTLEDYYATPEGTRMEFINGRFIQMPSTTMRHQMIVSYLDRLIGKYLEEHESGAIAVPGPVDVEPIPGEDTVVVPDVVVVCDPSIIDDHGIKGAPDWVIEVASPGNLGMDYITKLDIYNRAGVSEYWIVNPMKHEVQVSIFDGADSEASIYSFDEPVPSRTLEGLVVDFSKIKCNLTED